MLALRQYRTRLESTYIPSPAQRSISNQIQGSVRNSPSGSRTNKGVGGAEEDRTPDPLLAKQVLSQLSYSPIPQNSERVLSLMVGLGRFELPTSPLSGVRSNQLSYRPGIAQN
jgi:hypothetical protein